MNKYYVYFHYDYCGNLVYIGKGQRARYIDKLDRTKEHLALWDNLIKKKMYIRLSNDEAVKLETDLLLEYININGSLVGLFNKNVPSTLEYKQAIFKNKVKYDESSPTFLVWDELVSKKNRIGKVAGSVKARYPLVSINNQLYAIHRVVWCLFNGDIEQGLIIDHKNGNKKDNSIGNLRKVTFSDNNLNAYKNKMRLPCWHERDKVWYFEWVDILDGRKIKHKRFNPRNDIYSNLSEEEALSASYNDAKSFISNIIDINRDYIDNLK